MASPACVEVRIGRSSIGCIEIDRRRREAADLDEVDDDRVEELGERDRAVHGVDQAGRGFEARGLPAQVDADLLRPGTTRRIQEGAP